MRTGSRSCPSPPLGPFRWQLGLLLLCLARRLIPRGFSDFAPGGTDDPFPEPVGQAHPCQGCRLPDEGVMLWQESYPEIARKPWSVADLLTAAMAA